MTKVPSPILWIALLLVFSPIPVTAESLDMQAVELEWIEDFESYSPGLLTDSPTTWQFSGQGTAGVIAGSGVGGSQELSLVTGTQDNAELQQAFQSGFEPVIWIDFIAEMAPFADDADYPALGSESTVALQLTESGGVRVIDGATWQTLDLELSLDTPHRFTLRKDYMNRTWQLWVDGERGTASPLAFYSLSTREVPGVLRIEQQGQNESRFDNISVSTAAPAGLDDVGSWGTWHGSISWSGDSSPSGNPNRSNLVNLQEYAFGFHDPEGSPHFYQPGLTRQEEEPWLVLTYRKNRQAEDVRYIVQTSCALDDWETVEIEPGNLDVEDLGGGVDEITVKIPVVEPCQYVRLKTLLRE
jgi:hypothetical protein